MESSTQEDAITELKISMESYLANQEGRNMNAVSFDAYDRLLARRYQEREEELRIATEKNGQLDKRLNESEQMVRELQSNSTMQRLKLQENEEKLAEMAKVEEENKSYRVAILEAKEVTKERDDLMAKLKASEEKVQKMENDISGYQEMLEKRRSLAEEQITVLLENDKTIGSLEGKNAKLQDEVGRLKEQLTKSTHTIESKDTILDMQRQQMGRQEALLKIYEVKFQAKDVNIPQIIARSDEAERLWSKIEEREKKFAAGEIILRTVRNENASLQVEKKRLQAEVAELKQCFELSGVKLSGTNDKLHMPWLLAQIRNSLALSEKVAELEEIIRCEGYTVKAKEAESAYMEKEREISWKMEKVNQIIDMLKGQASQVEDMELPVLLGKLEECLHEFGEDIRPIDDIMSFASSDANQSMSLNTEESHIETKLPDNVCIGGINFKDLMHPNHYDIMTSIAAGFGCVDEDEKDGVVDWDDRDDVVHTSPGGDDNVDATRKDDALTDVHIEKVLKILHQNDDDSS